METIDPWSLPVDESRYYEVEVRKGRSVGYKGFDGWQLAGWGHIYGSHDVVILRDLNEPTERVDILKKALAVYNTHPDAQTDNGILIGTLLKGFIEEEEDADRIEVGAAIIYGDPEGALPWGEVPESDKEVLRNSMRRLLEAGYSK